MRTTTPQKLSQQQNNSKNIRNICILAHVDHGKTTLADTLVASNGIISQRMAGKLRYLDSREDEQLRGITMKSSAISLVYNRDEQDYLINLIDSPGHIDFSSEVSTAVRLCDGAIVLVDVVEGVCPQTHAVLRQAWLENIKPILVLNKIDRLITEWKMSPLEAHMHLLQTLEQVNAITAELFTSEVMEKSSAQSEDIRKRQNSEGEKVYDWSAGLEDTDDSNLYFSPDQGNVIFSCAIDGWGFRIDHFADLFSKKLGMSASALKKTLWGDFYLETKTKRIKKGAQSKGKKPLFVQFILENLWSVYEAVTVRRDKEMIDKIVKSLNLKIQARDARHNDPKVQLQAICSQWLPLSKAVLESVIEQLPSPLEIPQERAEKLLCPSSRRFDSLHPKTQRLKQDFLACSSNEDVPTILYVSKMFTIDRKALPQNKAKPLTAEEMEKRRLIARQRHADKMAAMDNKENLGAVDEEKAASTSEAAMNEKNEEKNKQDTENESDQAFIAFARVYSGTIRRGQILHVLGPKHDPAKVLQQNELLQDVSTGKCLEDLSSSMHITTCKIEDLYLLMGRELDTVDHVPAGNVLGIGGLEDHILKSATISDTIACPAFTEMYFEASPIVRVAIEPTHAGDMLALMRGLKLLNQSDPSVQVLVQQTGEHVIIAAGEVHLQKCIDDLQNQYAKVKINRSAPIVPFRETIIRPPKMDMVNEAIEEQNPLNKVRPEEDPESLGDGLIQMCTPDKLCSIQIRAIPLPTAVTKLLQDSSDLLKILDQYTSAKLGEKSDTHVEMKMTDETEKSLKDLKERLKDAFNDEEEDIWDGAVDNIWSFGPKRNGTNILLNRIENYQRPSIWACLEKGKLEKLKDFDHSIVNGFQMCCFSGPLCDEPMHGVCFCIEMWNIPWNTKIIKSNGANSADSKEELICDTQSKESSSSLNEKESPSDLSLHFVEQCNIGSEVSAAVDIPTQPHAAESPHSPASPQSPVSAGPMFAYGGQLTGQMMTLMMKCCRRAFQSQPQRLVVAMYTCVIQCTAEALGKMYAVLGKRNGRVLGDEMKEGSSVFNIQAVLPVIESFGFAEEIRKRTSGLASPQLKFSHWEVIDVDPFWVPTTEEEIMHFGEKADSENQALRYMNNVRKRKGLKVDVKIVEHAEKQRTLTKNK